MKDVPNVLAQHFIVRRDTLITAGAILAGIAPYVEIDPALLGFTVQCLLWLTVTPMKK